MTRVAQAIEITKKRNLDFQRHTPWQILHGLLALRENYTIKNGSQYVNALDFLSTQARYKGAAWFEATPHGGRAHPYNGTPYDFEGHVNQSLSIIAMCNVPLTHEFRTGSGKIVTMADMVRHAQMNVQSHEELTWTLWFLTHYLDQDTAWTNFRGERWSMEALVRNQNSSSVLTAPCGGCHNLFALAYARNAYMQKHGQLRGAWLEADQKLQQYISTAQAMQNRDGSFATQFFKARGYSTDFNERIKSSGHMLEWLLVALPKSRLNEPWIRNGVLTLANDMIQNAAQPADCGPLYHSLHALVLYQQRMQPQNEPTAQEQLTAKPELPQNPARTVQTLPGAANGNSSVTIVRDPQGAQTPATMSPTAPAPNTLPGQAVTSVSPPAPQSPVKPTTPPALSTPPALVAPPASRGGNRFMPRQPARLADQPLLRRLSGEGDKEGVTPVPVTEPEIEPSQLTPFPGGMPILKPSAAQKISPKTEAAADGKETESETDAKSGTAITEPGTKAAATGAPQPPTEMPATEATKTATPADANSGEKKAEKKADDNKPESPKGAEPASKSPETTEPVKPAEKSADKPTNKPLQAPAAEDKANTTPPATPEVAQKPTGTK